MYQTPDDLPWPGFDPPLPPPEPVSSPGTVIFQTPNFRRPSSSLSQSSQASSGSSSSVVRVSSQMGKNVGQVGSTMHGTSAVNMGSGGLGIHLGSHRSPSFSDEVNNEIRRRSSTKTDMAKIAAANSRALKHQDSFDSKSSISNGSGNYTATPRASPRFGNGESLDDIRSGDSTRLSTSIESFQPESPTRTTYDGDDNVRDTSGQYQFLQTPKVGEAFNSPALSGSFNDFSSGSERASSLYSSEAVGSIRSVPETPTQKASQFDDYSPTPTRKIGVHNQQGVVVSPPCPARAPPPTPPTALPNSNTSITPSQPQRMHQFQEITNAVRTPTTHSRHPSVIDSTPNSFNLSNELDPAYVGAISLDGSDTTNRLPKSRIPGPKQNSSPFGPTQRQTRPKPTGGPGPLSGSPGVSNGGSSPLTGSPGVDMGTSRSRRRGHGSLTHLSTSRGLGRASSSGSGSTSASVRSTPAARGIGHGRGRGQASGSQRRSSSFTPSPSKDAGDEADLSNSR